MGQYDFIFGRDVGQVGVQVGQPCQTRPIDAFDSSQATTLAPGAGAPLPVERVSRLPAAMGDPGTSATGTVLRPATLRSYARQAWFATVDILPLRSDTGRFYRLTR
ncbi:MAG: hypothetical protein ACTHPS_24085 [Streptosporangiaceae bacterium]